MHFGVVATRTAASAKLEIHEGQTAFQWGIHEIEASPVRPVGRLACEVDMLRLRSFSEQSAGPGNRQAGPGSEVNRRTGLNSQGDSVRDGDARSDQVRSTRGGPDSRSAHRSGD